MATFNLEIITPTELVLKQEANFVKLKTIEGNMGILPGHAPFVSALVTGELKIKFENQEEFYFISGGFLEISNNKVIILADEAINAKDLNIVLARKAADEARAILDKIGEEKEVAVAEKMLRESLMKIQILEK